MRVAALALVLIVASAVVLIFANTLNSWVLGGLIGGLAALLISIPISLIIFATLARRQDELLYAQMLLRQEEDDLAYEEQRQEYEERADYDEEDEYGRVYDVDAYYLPAEGEEYELPRGHRQPEIRSLPAVGQSYASSTAHSTAKLRAANTPPHAPSMQTSRRPTRELAFDHERGDRSRESATSRQNQQTGHQRSARSPYTTGSLRSQQQAAARKVARQEAAQGQGSFGSEQISTGPLARPATTRHLPPRSIQLNRSRAQEEASKKNTIAENRSWTETNRGVKRPSNAGRSQETRTDQLRDRYPYPTTGPMRLNPETGQIARNRQMDEQSSGDVAATGNLYNPLVRRAPYLYEDDELREELSQQIDKPITRRASRHLSLNEEQ